MSLNWDISKVKNREELWIRGKGFPMGGWKPVAPGEESDGEYLNPITDSLIWSCMGLEMGGITEKTVKEFWERLCIWNRIFDNATLFRWNDMNYCITYADIVRHVGLSVNVTQQTRAYFLKKIAQILDRDSRDDKIDPNELSLLDRYKEKIAAREGQPTKVKAKKP